MKLDDLQAPLNSQQLARLLQKHYGVVLPVEKLNHVQAQTMMESVTNRIGAVRNSHKIHVAERDTAYNVLVIMEQALTARLIETDGDESSKKSSPLWNVGKSVASATGTVLGSSAKAASTVGKAIPGASRYSDSAGIKDLWNSVRELYATYKRRKIDDKPANKPVGDNTPEQEHGVEINKFLASQTKVPLSDVNRLMAFMEKNGDITKLDKKQQKQLNTILKKLGQQKKRLVVNESRYRQMLSESNTEEAEVILAAKDLVDSIQDMVETLGKMVNEQLPALTDTIRDSMNQEAADQFSNTATGILNELLESVRSSREQLDSAARVLAGEEPVAPELGDDLEPTPDLGSDEDEKPSVPKTFPKAPKPDAEEDEAGIGREVR